VAPLSSHGGQQENLINAPLNLGVAPDMTFPIDHVAIIDFTGGQPPPRRVQPTPPAQRGGAGAYGSG
jgi:hypothetical protein